MTIHYAIRRGGHVRTWRMARMSGRRYEVCSSCLLIVTLKHIISVDSRALLTASYRSLLYQYIMSPPGAGPPKALIALLSSPRARLVDLSCLDPSSGRSLLHEAARRKDLSLIDLSIRAGADVFVRDRRGKAVGEGGGGSKDDRIRVFLRQCECSSFRVP